MDDRQHNLALKLVDDLLADDKTHFSFDDARRRLARSPSATANILRRAINAGFVDRVRRGRYAIRQIGLLGTRVAAENLAIAVAAAFSGLEHRMAYRTALDEYDLIVHPARTVQVAVSQRMRVRNISGRPLRTIIESNQAIRVGAVRHGPSWISSLERALLDIAARPDLSGGAATLVEALASAGIAVDDRLLVDYARKLQWGTALRRIGSVSDALEIVGLAGKLDPLKSLSADIDLEPSHRSQRAWRDTRWRVRWALSKDELRQVMEQ